VALVLVNQLGEYCHYCGEELRPGRLVISASRTCRSRSELVKFHAECGSDVGMALIQDAHEVALTLSDDLRSNAVLMMRRRLQLEEQRAMAAAI
jgi:hypothetical protein